MDGLITFVAEDLILLPIAATVFIIWHLRGQKRRRYLFTLIASGILAILLAKIASKLYYNPRPFLHDGVTPMFHATHDNGFPSDHTLLAAWLGFTALSYSKRWGVGLLLVAFLIGWARVAGGVHHLIDICGGFVFAGMAYLIVSQWLARRHKIKTKHQKT